MASTSPLRSQKNCKITLTKVDSRIPGEQTTTTGNIFIRASNKTPVSRAHNMTIRLFPFEGADRDFLQALWTVDPAKFNQRTFSQESDPKISYTIRITGNLPLAHDSSSCSVRPKRRTWQTLICESKCTSGFDTTAPGQLPRAGSPVNMYRGAPVVVALHNSSFNTLTLYNEQTHEGIRYTVN